MLFNWFDDDFAPVQVYHWNPVSIKSTGGVEFATGCDELATGGDELAEIFARKSPPLSREVLTSLLPRILH